MSEALSYHQLAPNGESAISVDRLAVLLDESGDVPREMILAIRGVVNWSCLLGATPEALNGESEAARKDMQVYLRTLGFLPDKKVLSSATRSTPDVRGARDRLLGLLTDRTLQPEELVDADAEEFAEQQQLTSSQVELLQSIVRHELALDDIDLQSLVEQFPFPVTQYNYFGRFIASNKSGPEKSARHLHMSTPFFVRMRSLLEGLSFNKKRFLVVQTVDRSFEEENESKKPPVRLESPDLNKILHACVSHASDFYGSEQGDSEHPSLACIKLPRLPPVSSYHIKEGEHAAFVAEFYDFLMTGDCVHDLLDKQALSVDDEKDFQRRVKKLESKKARLRLLKSMKPGKTASRVDQSRWERQTGQVENSIDDLNERISEMNHKRNDTKSVLQILNDRATMADLVRFREEVADARSKGQRTVFSVLDDEDTQRDSRNDPRTHHAFLQYMDRAYTSRHESPGIKYVQNASMLLNADAAGILKKGGRNSKASLVSQQLREIEIDKSEMNPSLSFVVDNILPEKTDPELQMLLNHLVSKLQPPGVSHRDHLTYVVRQSAKKRDLSADDYLAYVFDHAAIITQEQLRSLLEVLQELGIHDLPPRCKELAQTRFHLPVHIIEQYTDYVQTYRPDQVGKLPPLFTNLATLGRSLDLGLDSYGMEEEVRRLENHLAQTGLVAIVDGTDYHPELVREVHGEAIKHDQEATTEKWGDYVRPTERLIRAFSRHMMEGAVRDELKNHSLVSPQKPDKMGKILERLYKKFLGIDLNLTPDLSHINRVLSDLTMFDSNTIIVVNADNVRDMEQYRQFIALLEENELKVILSMREAMPGVPSVNIQPFLDHQIPARLANEEESLRRHLGIDQPIDAGVLEFTADQVKRMRKTNDDPLNLNLQVLNAAAQHARMGSHESLHRQDVIAAIPPIFHLPDADQMKERIAAVDSFVERAPLQIFGQQEPIRKLGSKIKSHILGTRDPSRPLTLLLPGPTGVGKTELMIHLAIMLNIPYFHIEGAEFSEPHSTARLVGSPSGYVGPDEGILYKFLDDNILGLTFIDEIEKMHPDVYQALMNYFDKAMLTAGNGKVVRRPGHIIVGASNAGADKLNRHMTDRELRDELSGAFVDRTGRKRPELVRRFDPIMMLALEGQDFEQLMRHNLHEIGNRFGFINANLSLEGVDETAVKTLYEASKDVCNYDERHITAMGFGANLKQVGTKKGAYTMNPSDIVDSGFFFDMRHVSRSLDTLAGSSIQRIVQEQYESGQYRDRDHARRVRLVGVDGLIELQEIGSPHEGNGKVVAG